MIDFITGDKIKSIAKWIYAPQKKHRDDYDNLQNTLDWTLLKNNDIIYTHTHHVAELFKEILDKGIIKHFYLISHNSDVNVDEVHAAMMPFNVVKWFTQNVCVTHPRIFSIPIGLENDRWLVKVPKLKIMNSLLRQHKYTEGLVYMNHNIGTNIKERLHVYTLLELQPWVDSERGRNGQKFTEYITSIFTHDFVICPAGNGMDTHRFWETLYMGSIPIVKRDLNNRFYTDLPVCFVDDWEEVTEKFLKSELKRIKASKWNMAKLEFLYWKNLIQKV